MDLALAGVLLSIIGVIITYLTQKQQNDEASVTNKKLQQTIETLQQTIDKQTQDILKYQTGGNSFGYLTFAPNFYGGSIATFHQKGDAPMFNVKINIFEHIQPGVRELKAPDFKIEETGGNEISMLGTVNLQLDWEKTLYIVFKARHKEWTEVYQYKKFKDAIPGGEPSSARSHIKIFEGYGVEGAVLFDDGIVLWSKL